MKKQTYTIEKWRIIPKTTLYWLEGYIPERFGERYVHTSPLLNINFETWVAETENTFYKLGKAAEL